MCTLGRSIFDNIYNPPFLISYYNSFSDILIRFGRVFYLDNTLLQVHVIYYLQLPQTYW
jgi:hypothetical protein